MEAQPSLFDPINVLSASVLGVVLLLLLFGWLWTKPSVERLTHDNDARMAALTADKSRAEAQRDSLQQTFQGQVIPVLTEVSRLMLEVTVELRKRGDK